MTLITDTLIERETLSVPSIVPVNGSQQYSNKYLVIEVTGGESETTPYPGITLEQIFVNNAQGLVGASLPLRIGKQLIEVMPFGLYKIRLIAQGGIVRATVKIWENTGVLYNYATETPATPDNNAGNITGEEIKNRLVDLVSPNRLPLSAIEGAENLGQNLQVTWENLTGKPTTFPPISHTHLWAQITDKPTFATVATSGDYNDLINKPAGGSGGGREVLTGDRTYFVRTDGNDNNSGLTNTAEGAFLTPGKAISILSQLDGGGYSATIKITGTFTTTVNVVNSFVGFNSITLEGDTTTPSNSTINVSSGSCINCDTFTKLNVVGFRLLNSGAGGNGVFVAKGFVNIGSMNFGAMQTSGRHIFIGGGTVNVSANYTISGGCFEHVIAQGGVSVYQASSKTITITGTPNFAGQFISANTTGTVIAYLVTFSGSATGKRYDVNTNGVVNTYGGSSTYFPGSASGTTATGGQYS